MGAVKKDKKRRGRKMKYEEILPIAQKYKRILEPYCNKVEIAGSIRRKKEECNDIELVIIRKPEKIDELKRVVDEWKRVKGDVRGRYTQRIVPEGLKLDIFIAADDGSNWGNIFLIRTGSWKFSRYMMGIKAKKEGYEHKGGYLWRRIQGSGVILKCECYSESDVFRYLGMEYIPPEERDW